ncbi:3-oxoadipate enol-lactonase [Actinomycetospora corticicola]|uniref:Pimeloyl-ACP methyl ester carboxylesterase n=1 Tax=Actinomycetospora corticicola TaxID=663602 RepID=A0A7Y9DX28_9PSEU|nr:alpha/beta fold hydrolase [Actinomycetospora corticicola]NYD37128.1 pimeloyl-ACP methyl ester carboxylesterase [Actinomycetospora corticicola]
MSDTAVVLGGARTRVVDEGVGPVVVLVHATPFDLDYWSGLAFLLRGERRVVRYDLRGHGAATDAPVPDTGRLVADLAELLDRLDLGSVHLVGHSLGATVVQCYALRYPERVRRLSLLAPRASPSTLFANLAEALRRDEAVADITINRWFTPPQLARNGSAVQYARTRVQATPVGAWADGLARLAETDVLAGLSRLTMPAEVVVGEDDHGAKPEHGRVIADALPTASFHLVPRARSLLALEHPEIVAPLLR